MGSALKVPVSNFDGHSLAKVRSALSRGMKAHNVKLHTQSDDEYLYIWKR